MFYSAVILSCYAYAKNLLSGGPGGDESVRTEMGKSKRKRKKGNLRNQYTHLFRGFTAYHPRHPRVFQFDFEFPFLYLFLFETLLQLEFFLTLFYTFHPLKCLFSRNTILPLINGL